MNKILKIIGLIVGAIFAVFVIGGLFIPKTTSLSRSIEIDATPEKVFPYVSDLKLFTSWNPWAQMDPDAKMTFTENTNGVSASYSWDGEKVGAGSMTHTRVEAPRLVESKLEFQEEGTASATFQLEAAGAGTKVTWSFTSDAPNLLDRWMGLMISAMLAPQYEQGLAKLKEMVEAAP